MQRNVFEQISHIVLDVDGTLTDGGIYYDDNGYELKKFHVKDGLMIKKIQEFGIKFIVITGRESSIVAKRMNELGISDVYQQVNNKKAFLENYMLKHQLAKEQLMYIGDDLNDLGAMHICGCICCPSDACDSVRKIAHYVAEKSGGNGAVRECLEKMMKEKQQWDKLIASMLL